MQKLLEFLLKGILGKEKFDVTEAEENGRIDYVIKTAQENVGMIIGKGGRMIKTLRNILKVRATLEKKVVFLNIGEE
jgi:predicted RNA-binding protein YlqC (UPF0109 family)